MDFTSGNDWIYGEPKQAEVEADSQEEAIVAAMESHHFSLSETLEVDGRVVDATDGWKRLVISVSGPMDEVSDG